MKITITQITKSDTDKNGQPRLDKNGRPYYIVMINTKEAGKGSMFAYQGDPQLSWKVGDEKEVEVSKTPDGKYTNFKIPKAGAFNLAPRIATLEEKVKNIEEWMAIQDAKDGVHDVQLGSEDIPFN